MLTKEHLKYRRRADRVYPVLIDPAAPAFLELAGELLALYRGALDDGMRRGELAEPLETLIRGSADQDLARAFNKLILDRCEFAAAAELDYAAGREKLFRRSGELLNNPGSLEEYQEALRSDPELAGFPAGDIYGDLPDHEQLLKMREMTPRELTDRYNLAQVQGLIMSASELRIQAADPEPAELRRLVKYLKFFRLLGTFRAGETENELNISISGPFSLFQNTRKYAVQLAAFFSAVPALKRWSLTAAVRPGDRELQLKLDEKSGLVSPYRHFSSYIPEEIRLFYRLFKAKAPEWRPVPGTAFPAGNGEVFFPDFSFRHESGKIVHLELFHRWHRTELDRRLELLAARPELPLLLGIDRALAGDREYAAMETRHPLLAARMFRFRDFPGVDRVRKMLDSFPSSPDCR